MDADNRIWWGEDNNNVPRIKRFLTEVQAGLIPQTVWDHSEVGHTQEAKQEYLRVLSDKEVFTTPKPIGLIQRILDIATNVGDTILDSFAGSGTTAQAVLERNAMDNGSRRFVLVQMAFDSKEQEKAKVNISQSITAERARRVIEGYSYTRRMAKGKKKKESVAGVSGSFTYCSLGESLFGEYRNFGKNLPAYEELAKYIFYTETSQEFDPKAMNAKTGRIGEHRGTAYFLLYAPKAKEDVALDMVWLNEVGAKEKCKKLVVYCEKLWAHRDELLVWEKKHGKSLRSMIVPNGLK